jgi:hypothetical protein
MTPWPGRYLRAEQISSVDQYQSFELNLTDDQERIEARR